MRQGRLYLATKLLSHFLLRNSAAEGGLVGLLDTETSPLGYSECTNVENHCPKGSLCINKHIDFSFRLFEVGCIGKSTLELGEMKHREGRVPALSHTASEDRTSNPSEGLTSGNLGSCGSICLTPGKMSEDKRVVGLELTTLGLWSAWDMPVFQEVMWTCELLSAPRHLRTI